MAGDDEAGSGATDTDQTDSPKSEDTTTPEEPPADREGDGEAPTGSDDDPSEGAGRSRGSSRIGGSSWTVVGGPRDGEGTGAGAHPTRGV